MAEDYDSKELNFKIDSIKQKLARQYDKSPTITIGKALEQILKQPDIKKNMPLAVIAIGKLRLYENKSLKVREYLSETYLGRNR